MKRISSLVYSFSLLLLFALPSHTQTNDVSPKTTFGLGKLIKATFSRDEERVITRGTLGDFAWDIQTGDLIGQVTEGVDTLAFNIFLPDGSAYFEHDSDRTLMRSYPDRTILRTFDNTSRYMVISDNGERLVTGGADSYLKVWNPHTGELLSNITYSGLPAWLEVSPDGKYILTLERIQIKPTRYGGNIYLWDSSTGELFHHLTSYSFFFYGMDFSPNSTKVITLSGEVNNVPRIFDVKTGYLIFSINISNINGDLIRTTFSPDGKYVIGGTGELTLNTSTHWWDAESGELIHSIDAPSRDSQPIGFSSDGENMLTRGENVVSIRKTYTGELVQQFIGHTGEINNAEIASDGSFILTDNGMFLNEMTLWDRSIGNPIGVIQNPNHPYTFKRLYALSSNDRLVLTSNFSYAKGVQIWDLSTMQSFRTIETELFVEDAIFTPDATKVIIILNTKEIQVRDISTGYLLYTFENESTQFQDIKFSSDGLYAYAHSSGSIIKWDIKTGKKIRVYNDQDFVSTYTISPDETEFLTGNYESLVQVWNLNTGQKVREFSISEFNLITKLDFSPNGKYLLVGGRENSSYNGIISIWNYEIPQFLRSFQPHVNQIATAKFTPDGKAILTSGWDGTAKLWELNDLLAGYQATPSYVNQWQQLYEEDD